MLAQFAKAAGLPPLALDGNDHLRLVFGESVDFALDYDEPEQRIVLSARLGQPPAAGREELFRQMLEVNAYWREMGGLTLGFDGATGEALQLRPLFLGALDYGAFEAALVGFVENAQAWMRLIGTADPGAAAARAPILIQPGLRA